MIRATPARFAHALVALGADRVPESLAPDLVARWSEPHRHYHTLDHLEACLASLDAHQGLATNPTVVEIALWFHDAIYDPRAPDNEERSAILAADALRSAGVVETHVQSICHLILATRTHADADDPDTALLLDLDLFVLGTPADQYLRYSAAIRREYAWVPEPDYQRKRAMILTRFLERSCIYKNAVFFSRLEASARANLATEIARLNTSF